MWLDGLPVIAAPNNSSGQTVTGVIIGGVIALAAQIVLYVLQRWSDRRRRWRETVAAARMLRDDMRAVQTRYAEALGRGAWWRSSQVQEALHTTDDLRLIANRVRGFQQWGAVSSSWRGAQVQERRRLDKEKFDAQEVARGFWYLEVARKVLARRVEQSWRQRHITQRGLGNFEPHPRAKEISRRWPDSFKNFKP